jgi:hypothetical protein
VQSVIVTASPPTNMVVYAGFVYANAASVPANMLSVRSDTYSLGSAPAAGVRRIAVMSFSLSSPNIPPNLRRVAIVPE